MSAVLHPLILVVDQVDHWKVTAPQLERAWLVAVREENDRFHLVKARRSPGEFTLSHFTEPVSRRTLLRYIGANLAD